MTRPIPQTRLFVPLKTVHYLAFESGKKDIELRGINDQFNPDTVVPGRRVELRRGYSTDDSIWGTIRNVWQFDDATQIPETIDHERIRPDSTEAEFLDSVDDLLGDYQTFIAFHVECDTQQ